MSFSFLVKMAAFRWRRHLAFAPFAACCLTGTTDFSLGWHCYSPQLNVEIFYLAIGFYLKY